jgi:tRNA (guanine37-N1)-methyltransferase
VRIDVVTIFPEYLSALDVSLIGKARRDGLLDIHVHDLREHTFDRHRTVDDTPYGGGAGMVMKPEPWALALESIADAGRAASLDRPVLLVPTPSGQPFRQSLAQELSGASHLVVACGRYEGIDERVFHWARERFDVRLVSLGDYVLNGGEVAALAMIEAIGRLVPGVVGNPESLVEESHSDGLLEYPVYTKPASWRGHEVPEVLLSGDHGKVAAWRHAQQLERTRDRRPDLLPASGLDAG